MVAWTVSHLQIDESLSESAFFQMPLVGLLQSVLVFLKFRYELLKLLSEELAFFREFCWKEKNSLFSSWKIISLHQYEIDDNTFTRRSLKKTYLIKFSCLLQNQMSCWNCCLMRQFYSETFFGQIKKKIKKNPMFSTWKIIFLHQ